MATDMMAKKNLIKKLKIEIASTKILLIIYKFFR